MNISSAGLSELLSGIIAHPELHAKWLNTLSYMESAGSRKIYRFQDRILTGISILKHSAEEARHAYFLKKQIGKLDGIYLKDYRPEYLFAANESYRYLDRLDVLVCKFLRDHINIDRERLKYASYLLVTYVIELRADELYDIYQQLLTKTGSRVNVKSIIAEEAGHLAEMERRLADFSPNWLELASAACGIEQRLYEEWIVKVAGALA